MFVSPAFGATCPAMPPVPWWKKSHASVEKYVQRKYKGNWGAYTKKWKKVRRMLSKLYVSKKPVYLKSRDLLLEGDELRDYIDHVDTRIRVIECLAKNRGTKTAKSATQTGKKSPAPSNDEFATAASSTYSCKPIPEVAWWGDLNHDNIKVLVKRSYKGDWQRYIKFWDEEMSALMASFGLGQDAVVNKLGLALSNEDLALYVSKVAGMIAVLNCLADDAKSNG